MIDALRTVVLRIGDGLLEWVLILNRDVGVIALGFISGGILVVLRLATTDRDRLRLISDDEKRLRELRRTARLGRDHTELARLRNLRRLIAGQRARAEWKHLAATAAFLFAMLTWGAARLEFLPIHSNHQVQFVARVSAANPEDVALLVPQSGIVALDGWIRPLETANGELTAVWRLTIERSNSPRNLVVRCCDRTFEHPVLVGGTTYLPPARQHAGGIETEFLLTPYEPFGLIPARIASLPGWALLLSAATAVAFFVLRRLWRIP